MIPKGTLISTSVKYPSLLNLLVPGVGLSRVFSSFNREVFIDSSLALQSFTRFYWHILDLQSFPKLSLAHSEYL